MGSKHSTIEVSVVVPLFNEAGSISRLNELIVEQMDNEVPGAYEIIYCNDGSTDHSVQIIQQLHAQNPCIKLLSLSRNFGKEIALAAGIAAAQGGAIITLDGDGQHPPHYIPQFLAEWRKGAQVVVGIPDEVERQGVMKRVGSWLFYSAFSKLTHQRLSIGTSDFCLIDRAVQREFVTLKEPERITRGLIEWLGFRRVYVHFRFHNRIAGTPTYSLGKLAKLATNSFISMSPAPLYLFGYLGIFITAISFILGMVVFIEQLLLNDPWGWEFTGTAMLSILLLFVVGILLMAQGIMALYISHIHSQTKGRPLFIIDQSASIGVPIVKTPQDT